MSLKSLLAKGVLSTLVVTLICSYSFTDLAGAQQHDKVEENTSKNEESSFTMNDPELYQDAKDLGMTDEEIIQMDKVFDEELITVQNPVAAVLGIITGLAAVVTANYQGGKYIAKQVHKRGALSKATYKKYRWSFRTSLPPILGIPGTFGFDDYFMDI